VVEKPGVRIADLACDTYGSSTDSSSAPRRKEIADDVYQCYNAGAGK
jgi:hypothetical protein